MSLDKKCQKINDLLKYHQVICFDKDGNIFDKDEYVVAIDTTFECGFIPRFLNGREVQNYLNYIKFSRFFKLTMDGVKEVEPIVLAYLDNNGEYIFTLARHGDYEYAEKVVFNTHKKIMYDVRTRTMFYLKGKETINELWAKVEDDVMVSSFGRVKYKGKFLKQERRRVDYTVKGQRRKWQVKDLVHKFYNRKEGECRTKHAPLNFYYKNIVRRIEE